MFKLTKNIISIEIEVNQNTILYSALNYSSDSETTDILIKSTPNFQELYDLIHKVSKPIVLTIVGKSVVNKVFHSKENEGENITLLIKNQIPGINLEKITYSLYHKNQQYCLSLIKKDVFHKCIKNFLSKKLIIANVYIGAGNLLEIKCSNTENGCFLNNHQLLYENKKLVSIQYAGSSDHKPDKQTINGKPYLSRFSLLIINAQNYKKSNEVSTSVEIEDFIKNFNNELLYKKILFIFLAISFVVLFINFILFSVFYDKSIQQNTNSVQNLLIKRDTLNAQFTRQIEFIESNTIIMQNNLSFYSDRIANSIPVDITLNSLQINPVVFSKEKISFEKGVIVVQGSYLNNDSMTAWIKELNSFDWITYITVDFCKYDYEKKTNYFSLTINYQ